MAPRSGPGCCGEHILIRSAQVGVPRSVMKAAAVGQLAAFSAATAEAVTAPTPPAAVLPPGDDDVNTEGWGTGSVTPADSGAVVELGAGPRVPPAPLSGKASSLLQAGESAPLSGAALSLVAVASATLSGPASSLGASGHGQGPGSNGGGAVAKPTRSERKRQWKQLRRDKKARRTDPAAEEVPPAAAWIPGE